MTAQRTILLENSSKVIRVYFLVSENEKSALFLIGKGLVGHSVYKCLRKHNYKETKQQKINWSNNEIAFDIFVFIAENLKTLNTHSQVNILWSAGCLGFNASKEDIGSEKILFENVINLLSKLDFFDSKKPRFFLLSSIGGLFEGQIAISDKSTPRPKRPYGKLKLFQEESAQHIMTNFDVIVLRLSSVYGLINRRQRMGLIQVLLLNGILRKTTTIVGTLDTLRDYVFVNDIAQFITRLILSKSVNKTLFHLVSGKPSSILQIKHIVERLISKPLFLSFSKKKLNALDIPCVNNNYDGLWLPSPLEVNIQKIYIERLNQK